MARTGRPKQIKIESNRFSKDSKQERASTAQMLETIDFDPEPPKYLSKEAKKEFRDCIQHYKEIDMTILGFLDTDVLAQYCDIMTKWKLNVKLENELDKQKKEIYQNRVWGDEDQQKRLDGIRAEQSALRKEDLEFIKAISKLRDDLGIGVKGRVQFAINITEKKAKDPQRAYLTELKKDLIESEDDE